MMEGTWTLCMGCGRITPFMSDTGYQVGLGGEKRVKGHEVMDVVATMLSEHQMVGSWRGPDGLYHVEPSCYIEGRDHALALAGSLSQVEIWDWAGMCGVKVA